MSPLPIPRALLEKHFGGDERMMRAMDEQSRSVANYSGTVAATISMNDASVVTLSPNAAFDNEYVLSAGYGILLDINTGNVSVRIDPALIVTTQAPVLNLSTLVNAASDTAAASAGVPIGGIYRNGSVLMVRAS